MAGWNNAMNAHTERKWDRAIWISIVSITIGILLAVAVPSFVKSRSYICQPACIGVLRAIDAAKEDWATANGKTNGDDVVVAEVNRYIGTRHLGGHAVPTCPAGGTYTYGRVGVPPQCSFAMTNSDGTVLRHGLGGESYADGAFDVVAGVPPAFRRGSIVVTNGTTGCMVAGSHLPATNELWLTRGNEVWRITLEAGESCLQILGASGANRVFVLTRDSLTVKWSHDRRTVLSQTYDLARLLELTLPQAGMALSSTTVKELWVRDDLEDSEMRSWVNRIVGVSPDGTTIRAERAMPIRIPNGTQWQYITMTYDVDRKAWRPD